MSRYISVCRNRCPGMSVFVKKAFQECQYLWKKIIRYVSVCGERWPVFSEKGHKNTARYISICGKG